MQQPNWSHRYLESTRGRIIKLLRSTARTVNELAEALDLTDNAVRVHLVALERDGLVRQSGQRRGLRKPHVAYRLTPEAEDLFPKAYNAVINTLLAVLTEDLAPEKVEVILREVGHRLAEGPLREVQGRGLDERIQKAIEVLGDMGGLAQQEREEGKLSIQGASCPLAAIVVEHPQVCRLAETLLSDIIGVSVNEHCQQGEPPQCRFEIATR